MDAIEYLDLLLKSLLLAGVYAAMAVGMTVVYGVMKIVNLAHAGFLMLGAYFALEMYEKVALAYIAGIKKYVADGGNPDHVSSVASFFISRIDSMVDAIIKARLKTSTDPKEQAQLRSLQGKVAIANAKLTYVRYKEIFSGPEWDALAKKGAQTQRLLWASTSTKDPAFSDVLYVEELIGTDTVNTMPPQTLDRYVKNTPPPAPIVWRQTAQVDRIATGRILRLEFLEPVRVHWSTDNWTTVLDSPAVATGLGSFILDLPNGGLSGEGVVRFTMFWPQQNRWEGADFQVAVFKPV